MNREKSQINENLLAALSAGIFFILVAVIFTLTPSLFEELSGFFRDFAIVRVPNTDFSLPAPKSPAAHSVVFSAVWQFSFIWSLFQLFVFTLRVFVRSPLKRKAQNVSDLIFWFGTGFLIYTFLNETTALTTWFVFWPLLIMLIGVSLVIRGIILATRR